MKFEKLPKIELHCHLDGSIRVETAIELIKKENIKVENLDYNYIKEELVVPEDCPSLEIYLKRFDLPVKLMQRKENLKRIAYELIEDVSKENVKYIEIRFAPLLHKEKGLTIKEIISSVIEGLEEGERDFNVKSNLILSLLRHMTIDSVYEVIEEGKEFIGSRVVAVDLAGVELEGFAKPFEEAFTLAKSYGYRITIHAGETGFSNNVKDAIEILGAERIGHAVAIEKDEEAYNVVKNNNVTLEMCPKSNVQTKAVKGYEYHPLKKFLNEGLRVNLSTDNRTVSDITLSKELETLEVVHKFTFEDYKKSYLDSVMGAFCSEEIKNWLIKELG